MRMPSLNTAAFSVRDVLTARRPLLVTRLVGMLILSMVYGSMVGTAPVLIVLAAYAMAQGIEVATFSGAAPWIKIGGRYEREAGLAMLAVNSIIYGSPSVFLTREFGSWGDVSAAYLLCGTMINALLTTIACRSAFRACLYPYMFYLGIMPLNTPAGAMPLTLPVLFSMLFGALFLSFNAWQMWRVASRSKRNEIAAARQYVAERDANEQLLSRMAQQDALTGLLNRDVLQARLALNVADGRSGALLMIDLDGFKYVNDTLGHSAGDKVLREVARRLAVQAAETGIAARLGGDEFALLLPDIADPAAALAVANALLAAISQPLALEANPINIGASIGVVLHPLHGGDAENLFANADLALYEAKAEGRHCARLYHAELRARARGKVLRDSELRTALEHSEFEMFYQPQVRLSDGALIGAEALLRWRHPEQGLLAPAAFLSALEGGLLSAQVGAWVIETACRQAASWRQSGLPDFKIAVNVFGAQFRAGNLVDWVGQACAQAGLPATALEIEITENVILRHEDEVIAPLRELRALGVGVAFDDFGTGFASLSMLTRFPVSRLKIDQSFTRAICESAPEAAVIHAMIEMAGALGLAVTAEGVETQAQAAALELEGCEAAQGFYFGAPMRAAAFTHHIAQRTQSVAAL
jgi:diguanylate cyclase (GGDEF)-like protein